MNKKTKLILIVLLALLLVGAGLFWWWRTAPLASQLVTVAPDDIEVVLDRDRNKLSDFLDTSLRGLSPTDRVPVVITTKAGFDTTAVTELGAEPLIPNVFIAQVDQAQLSTLSGLDAVLIVEEDQVTRGQQADDLGGFGDSGGTSDGQPANNPSRAPPRVAVLDSGVDLRSPLIGPDAVAGWYDTVNHADTPYDDEVVTGQHGTKVSGIILEDAPTGTQIVSVKVLDDQNHGRASNLLEGLQWTSDNADELNIRVVNLSISFGDYNYAVERVINELHDKSVVIVAAAGNDASNQLGYPAAYENVISVGAYDTANNSVANFSNAGRNLDVVADGVDVWVERDGQRIYIGSGTSFAAPDVIDDILQLIDKGVTNPDDIRRILNQAAQDVGARGVDARTGSGLIPKDINYDDIVEGSAKPPADDVIPPQPGDDVAPSPDDAPQPGDEVVSEPIDYSQYAMVLTGAGTKDRDGNFLLASVDGEKAAKELDEYLAYLEATNWEAIENGGELVVPDQEKIQTLLGESVSGKKLDAYYGAHLRYGHTVTKLPDGRVLIAGGTNGEHAIRTAHYYDPATGNVELIPDEMNYPRVWHTATLLGDGNVLILGGRTSTPEATAELGQARGLAYKFFEKVSSVVTPLMSWLFASEADGADPLDTGEVFLAEKNRFVSLKDYFRSKDIKGFSARSEEPNMLQHRAKHTATYIPTHDQVLILGGQAEPHNPVDFDYYEDRLDSLSTIQDQSDISFSVSLQPDTIGPGEYSALKVSLIHEKIPFTINRNAIADVQMRIVGDARFVTGPPGDEGPPVKVLSTILRPQFVPNNYSINIYTSPAPSKDLSVAVEVTIQYQKRTYKRVVFIKRPKPESETPEGPKEEPLRLLVYSESNLDLPAIQLAEQIRGLGHDALLQDIPDELAPLVSAATVLYDTSSQSASRGYNSTRILRLVNELKTQLDYSDQVMAYGSDYSAVIIMARAGSSRDGFDEPPAEPEDEEVPESPEAKLFSVFADAPDDKSIGGEILDLATGQFVPLSESLPSSTGHTATLLNSGQVVIAGGTFSSLTIYDPRSNRFTPQAQLPILKNNMLPLTIKSQGGIIEQIVFYGGEYMTFSDLIAQPAGRARSLQWFSFNPAWEVAQRNRDNLATFDVYDVKQKKLITLQAPEVEGLPTGYWSNLERAAYLTNGLGGLYSVRSAFPWVLTYGDQPGVPPAHLTTTGDRVEGNQFVLYGTQGTVIYDANANLIKVIGVPEVTYVRDVVTRKSGALANINIPRAPFHSQATSLDDGTVLLTGGQLQSVQYPTYASYSKGGLTISADELARMKQSLHNLNNAALGGAAVTGLPLGGIVSGAFIGPALAASAIVMGLSALVDFDEYLTDYYPEQGYFRSIASRDAWIFKPVSFAQDFVESAPIPTTDDEVVGSSNVEGRLDRPNPPAHEYAGELLKGGMPKTSTQAVSFKGSEYSLDISFDKDYISPALGSTITGTVRLLKDGQPVSKAPAEMWPVTGGTSGNPTGTPIVSIGVANAQLDSVTVPDNYVPGIDTQLYSPNYRTITVNKRGQPHSVVGLDISDGEAQFEFRYGGARTHGFLEFNVSSATPGVPYSFFKPRRMTTTAGIYFEDQIRSDVDIPNLNTTAQGDIYYDARVSPASAAEGEEKILKLEITARNSRTGQVDTNPYQRVEVEAPPISRLYNNRGPRIENVPAGYFVGLGHEAATEAMQIDMIIHRMGHPSRPVATQVASTSLDLVNGRGSAYFNYTGERWIAPYLTFVIQPTAYDGPSLVAGRPLADPFCGFTDSEIDQFNISQAEKDQIKNEPRRRICEGDSIPQSSKAYARLVAERRYAQRQAGVVSYHDSAGITEADYPPVPEDTTDEWGIRREFSGILYREWVDSHSLKELVAEVHTVITVPIK